MTTTTTVQALALGAALLIGVWAVQGQAQDKPMGGHDMSTMGEGEMMPSTAGFMKANEIMMEDMQVEYTGDTDVDFARGMIPHHKGAIAMAQVMIDNGKDPELLAMAEEIISAQEAEIATLEAWLAANAK